MNDEKQPVGVQWALRPAAVRHDAMLDAMEWSAADLPAPDPDASTMEYDDELGWVPLRGSHAPHRRRGHRGGRKL